AEGPRCFPNASAGQRFLSTASQGRCLFVGPKWSPASFHSLVATPSRRRARCPGPASGFTKQGIKLLRRKRPAGHAKAKKCIYILEFWCRRADMLSFLGVAGI